MGSGEKIMGISDYDYDCLETQDMEDWEITLRMMIEEGLVNCI